MNIHTNPSRFAFVLAGAAALLLAACSASEETLQDQTLAEPPLAGADIGGEFTLVNKNGETVRWSDFEGQYRIVYFGFTYCPDICPTDMQRTAQGLRTFAKSAPDLAAKIQPIFISIDPTRDTPEIVGEFASAFSDDLMGLTGTPEQIAQAAKNFRVFYARSQEGRNTGDIQSTDTSEEAAYLMDHSRIVYLFGPGGEPLATLPADENADAVATELAKWVK